MEQPIRHIAVCPGSFDPLTNGHLDVIGRAAHLFGQVIVAVAEEAGKEHLFTAQERVDIAREACAPLGNVKVDSFSGLVVEYARRHEAVALVKGLRAISDFEHEVQMALMNRRLCPDVETVFLMAGEAYSFISSRMVKEVIRLGGDIAGLVPASVEVRLKDRILRGV